MSLEEHGFAWTRRAVDPAPFAALYPMDMASARGIEREPLIQQLADQLCPAGNHLLRAIFFNKTAKGNWLVPWHQDIVIKDAHRAWTPTAAELGRILACRIHLDPADRANGCLRVIPGSHTCGILPDAEIESWRAHGPIVDCEAAAGDVLWMRPLLLHASSKAAHANPRRVIHLEFGDAAVGFPL
jgi:ectoine hydroxylase-related dioxygenase (phytanoyl-CoA dioxygenase family)